MDKRWIHGVAAAVLLVAASQAGAQTTYRCPHKGGVTYSQTPCTGGTVVTDKPSKKAAARYVVPPQDRAKAARRAELTPEARKECSALDKSIPQQEAFVRTRGTAVTPDEERPLVKSRLRFRELRC
jgi:hypothetical protein